MKLHPLSIPYRVLENGVRLGVVLLFAVATGGSSGSVVIGPVILLGVIILGLAIIVGYEVAYFSRFAYMETDDTFDITSGVLSRRRREIPYERIQNVDIAQNPIQRVLGIAEVRLETAGGQQTEAELSYVAVAEAERLQDAISAATRELGETGPSDADGTELFALGDRELAVLGVVATDLRFLGLLSIVASVAAPALAAELAPPWTLLLVFGPAIAVIALLGAWILSGLRAIARYYGFRLDRQDEELRYSRGLLQRYSGTIPLEKVQTLTIQENVLARALGYASVSIETAGYGGQEQGQQVQSAVPIARREKALALLQEVETVPEFDFQHPPTRARTRYIARYTFVVVALFLAAWTAHTLSGELPAWPATAALILAVLPAAHLRWKHLGYHVSDDHVVTRRGFWTRRTMIVPAHRVQTITRSRTIFQRRRRLATLLIDTAGGGGFLSGDAKALDIDAASSVRLREQIEAGLQATLNRNGGRQ